MSKTNLVSGGIVKYQQSRNTQEHEGKNAECSVV